MNGAGMDVRLAAFEAAAQAAVAGGGVPSVVAMAADRDRVLYANAIGALGVPRASSLDMDDVFLLASMTKPITGFAAALLIEQGKLDLDQEAAAIVPEIARLKVLAGFDDDGRPLLRDPLRPIRLRHLFTHSSGISTDVWNPMIARYKAENGLPGMSTCRRAALFVPLAFDPGERWEYGSSVDWLGQVIEAVSGMPLDQYFRRFVFAPLGMEMTGFILTPAQRARLVPVRARTAAGRFEPTGFEVSQDPEFFLAGAGLYGTAADYMAFVQMLLNRGRTAEGGRLAKPETIDLYFADHLGGLTVPSLRTTAPALSADLDLLPGNPKTWSLGFMINTRDVPGRRRAGSQFWAGLASSYVWLDPASGLAGFLMMSYFPFLDPAGTTLFDAFERDVYATFGC